MSTPVTGPAELRQLVRTPVGPARPPKATGFAESLDRLLDAEPTEAPAAGEAPPIEARPVVLSKHAKSRLASRGVDYGPARQAELADALTALDDRGAKKALVLTGRDAWIVGVEKRTVITVMSREEALGQVFTDLDATFVAG